MNLAESRREKILEMIERVHENSARGVLIDGTIKRLTRVEADEAIIKLQIQLEECNSVIRRGRLAEDKEEEEESWWKK